MIKIITLPNGDVRIDHTKLEGCEIQRFIDYLTAEIFRHQNEIDRVAQYKNMMKGDPFFFVYDAHSKNHWNDIKNIQKTIIYIQRKQEIEKSLGGTQSGSTD
jgi:hypothetical protein